MFEIRAQLMKIVFGKHPEQPKKRGQNGVFWPVFYRFPKTISINCARISNNFGAKVIGLGIFDHEESNGVNYIFVSRRVNFGGKTKL